MNAIVKDGQLVVTIPLAKDPPTSSSGKSKLYATGNVKIPHDGKVMTVQVNAHAKP